MSATLQLAADLGARAAALVRWIVATAESCTGGLIAGAITDVAGSSGWFDRGFVTYSNEAKIEMLGVRAETLDAHRRGQRSDGARNGRRRARAKRRGHRGRRHRESPGPRGGTADKPVGLVCFAWAYARRRRGRRLRALSGGPGGGSGGHRRDGAGRPSRARARPG